MKQIHSMQCHQHAYLLTVNPLDNDLVCSHMGSIGHYTDLVRGSWQVKVHFISRPTFFGHISLLIFSHDKGKNTLNTRNFNSFQGKYFSTCSCRTSRSSTHAHSESLGQGDVAPDQTQAGRQLHFIGIIMLRICQFSFPLTFNLSQNEVRHSQRILALKLLGIQCPAQGHFGREDD